MTQANSIYTCKNCSKEYSTEKQTNFKSNQFCCKECFEEYNKTSIIKQRTYYCEYCGIEFIPFTKKKSIRFCCPSHSAKYVHLSEEEQISRTKKYRKPYVCWHCGKKVTSENWYGSGMFCCEKCSRSYASKYANTEEKRKEKSNTLKNKELVIKHCKKCGCEVLVKINNNNVLCDECKLKNIQLHSNYTIHKNVKTEELYNKILKLTNDYNLYDIEKLLCVKHEYFKNVIKLYEIKENPKFYNPLAYSLIDFCKNVLNKSTSITLNDVDTVKNILIEYIYEHNMSPRDVAKMFGYDKNGSGLIRNCFHIELKSMSESVHSYHERIGTYNIDEEKENNKRTYYLLSSFKFNILDYPNIPGYELINKYGLYNSYTNKEGVSMDHMISRIYGFQNDINPLLIAHPANCEIMKQTTNASKRENCSITVEELKEAIKEWDAKYGVYNKTIYKNNLLNQ